MYLPHLLHEHLLFLALQVLIDGMGLVPVDLDLGHHREGDAKVAGAEGLDLILGPGFLASDCEVGRGERDGGKF